MALEVLEHVCHLGRPWKERREYVRRDLVERQRVPLSIQRLDDVAEAQEVTDEW